MLLQLRLLHKRIRSQENNQLAFWGDLACSQARKLKWYWEDRLWFYRLPRCQSHLRSCCRRPPEGRFSLHQRLHLLTKSNSYKKCCRHLWAACETSPGSTLTALAVVLIGWFACVAAARVHRGTAPGPSICTGTGNSWHILGLKQLNDSWQQINISTVHHSPSWELYRA